MDLYGPSNATVLWLDHARALGAVAAVGTALGGVGFGLGRWLPLGRAVGERALNACLVGLAVLGPALYWAGHLVWSEGWLSIVVGVAVVRACWEFGCNGRAWVAAIRAAAKTPWGWLVAVVLAGVTASALATPLGGIEDEAIASTLLAAQRWLVLGASGVVGDHPFTALPWNAETLYAVAFALGGPAAPGVLGVFFLALLGGVAWRCALDCGVAARWAPAAGLLVVTLPALLAGGDQVRSESVYGALGLGAFRAALLARDRRRAVLAATLAGGAAATVLQGWFVAAVTLAIAVVVLGWRRGGRRAWQGGGAALALVVVLGAPWLVRNYYLFNAPVLPPPSWFWPDFVAAGWSRSLAVDVHYWLRGVWLGPAAQPGGLLDFLLLPWQLDRHAADFQIAPLPLAVFGAALLGVLALRRKAIAWWGLGWSIILLVAWFFSWRNGRLLAPVAALGCVAATAGLAACDRAGWRRGVLVVLLGAIGLSAVRAADDFVGTRRDRMRTVVSVEAARARMARGIPFREVLRYVNETPSVGRVLILTKWLPGYYLDKDYVKVAGHFGESPVVLAPNYDLAIARAAALGCSHVLDLREASEGWHVWRPQERVKLEKEWPQARLFAVEPTMGGGAGEMKGKGER